MTEPILWERPALRLLDQRRLPGEVAYLSVRTPHECAAAIRDMVVRGAPAIGITAAYGMALAATGSPSGGPAGLLDDLRLSAEILKAARPTAVNLAWAADRLFSYAAALASEGWRVEAIRDALVEKAVSLHHDEVEACRAIGQHSLPLVPEGARILTHCNAGALATGGYGTALGVVRAAHHAGRVRQVFADETRPYLQGARLTAFELHEEGIPVTVICDNMAGWLMAKGEVDFVVVGADRIAANGDTANKIGTYSLAVLAKHHGIPFYVAAPISTFDLTLAAGEAIPIEHRSSEEVSLLGGTRVTPVGVSCLHPGFDVTPAALITAIVTERGLVQPVTREEVVRLCTPAAP